MPGARYALAVSPETIRDHSAKRGRFRHLEALEVPGHENSARNAMRALDGNHTHDGPAPTSPVARAELQAVGRAFAICPEALRWWRGSEGLAEVLNQAIA